MLTKLKPYIVSTIISLGIGGLGAFLTKDSMEIYSEVNRPPIAPPSWLFPVVWSILYVLMGIAAALVWKNNGNIFDTALFFYGLQLVFNFFWSIIFFNFRAFFISFVWLIALLILIFITMILFFKKSKTAGFLLLPYFAWVCFAGYLNYRIWVLN